MPAAHFFELKIFAYEHEVALPGPQLLSDYVFLHYNYKYDWLRWTLEEIVDTYTKLYGRVA